jgi:hypothetical protein
MKRYSVRSVLMLLMSFLIITQLNAQKTYITGTSAGDNKLKAFNQKMDALEASMEEFKTFLASDEVYDRTKHFFIQLEGEGASLLLKHRIIERDIKMPLDDIEKGKMYAKEYPFSEEQKRYDVFVQKYTDLKKNSNARAQGHLASKKQDELESSHEYKYMQHRKAQMFMLKAEDDFSSNFHKQHVGKIAFSSSQISKTGTEGKLNPTFNATDRIYARAYFKNSFWNTNMYDKNGDSLRYMEHDHVKVYANIYIDGVKQDLLIEQSSITEKEYKSARTQQLWFHPLVSDGLTEINWLKIIAGMSIGTHNVKVEYCIRESVGTGTSENRYEAILATGEFKLIKNDKQLPKIGKKWSDFKAGTKNPALEAKALAIAQKNSNIDNMKSVEIKILDSDWRIVKNEYTGAILYRYMQVLLKTSHPDGYCHSTPMEIKQEYVGGSYSSNLLLVGLLSPDFGYDGYIDCE